MAAQTSVTWTVARPLTELMIIGVNDVELMWRCRGHCDGVNRAKHQQHADLTQLEFRLWSAASIYIHERDTDINVQQQLEQCQQKNHYTIMFCPGNYYCLIRERAAFFFSRARWLHYPTI